jgi:hypothetical protein
MYCGRRNNLWLLNEDTQEQARSEDRFYNFFSGNEFNRGKSFGVRTPAFQSSSGNRKMNYLIKFGGKKTGIHLKCPINGFKAAVVLGLSALFSCTGPGGGGSGDKSAGETLPETAGQKNAAKPLVIIKPGINPLWFEFGPQGPLQISSPEEASLNPFEPWPFSRLTAGLLPWKDGLVLVVNREGFLSILPWTGKEEGVVLYRTSGSFWKDYTVSSPFIWENTPGTLLYRNDFFLDPVEAAPAFRAWGLLEDFQTLGLEIPAFAGFPEDWDVEALQQGQDGFWYYHLVRKGGVRPEHRYYRSADLESPGEESPAGAFRNALCAYPPAAAPGLLGPLLERAFALYGREHTAEIASSLFEGSRQFAADPGGEGDLFSGYYAGSGGGGTASGVLSDGTEEYALVINSTGNGVYAGRRDGQIQEGSFFLPALPEGFAYTKIGLSGPALIAAWEEQQDLSVGAAGFLVITPP